MFAAATLMVINKIDLLPYVSFDVSRCIEYARQVNPTIDVICVSATRGDGMDDWLDWLLPPRVDEHLRTRKQPFRGRTGLQQVM
jgi:hydrogenase nickel incorporation protein HypB